MYRTIARNAIAMTFSQNIVEVWILSVAIGIATVSAQVIGKGRGQFLLEAQLEYCFLPSATTVGSKGLRPPLKRSSVATIKEGFESPS
jgi:hypothetical protein